MATKKQFKKWYTFSDAARWLTNKTGEELNYCDVIQIAVDGELGCYYPFQSVLAERVALVTVLPILDRVTEVLSSALYGDLDLSKHAPFEDFEKSDEFDVKLNGFYKINLLKTPHVKDDLIQEMTGNTADYAGMEGVIVDLPDGTLVRLLDTMKPSKDELEELNNDLSSKKISFPEYCKLKAGSNYPTDWRPIPEELYISGDEMQHLVNNLDSEEEARPSARQNKDPAPKTINTYLKIIGALAEALIDGRTPNPNTDANAVEAELARKGISMPVSSKTLAFYLKDSMK
jgi:hypothetical protein